jgi:hypothetical protein
MTSPVLRLAKLVIDEPIAAIAMASNLLIASKAKKARVRVKQAPRKAKEDAAAKRQERKHRELEEHVHLRAAGRCELCGDPWAPWDKARVMHHLELGSSKTKTERLENCMSVHPACHQAIHISEKAWVRVIKAHCAKHGYPLPDRRAYR